MRELVGLNVENGGYWELKQTNIQKPDDDTGLVGPTIVNENVVDARCSTSSIKRQTGEDDQNAVDILNDRQGIENTKTETIEV